VATLAKQSMSPTRLKISIIIPTVNEASELATTLHHAADADEIIIADGGSTDASLEIARNHGCKIIQGRGRAQQMNSAAQTATGDVLIFLHADTHLPQHWRRDVETLFSTSHTLMLAFRLSIRNATPVLKFMCAIANIRSRWFHRPYGDQALVLRRDDFAVLGGFPDVPIMEDLLFSRKIAKLGKIIIADSAVSTSARRWQNKGAWKTFFINQSIIIGYWCGVPLPKLAKLYRSK
jgi:rSAM/selenodomain-associated transferase 2